ncbi:transient receptor potential cation channel subfamily V member 5-like [Argiope bruennichi]|uniref:transient receptor potential cation channel subfamily V member 5-like n=1 Tax=Argiope bruennichi TaxID=94029 RepID=UPI002494C036|nr:transient receptor potential cation channel subfamily V member 5-like [Argiope bruennichi]
MGAKYSVENLLKFSDRGASSLATSLLDEIVSKEEANQSLSPLYLLANFKKSGSLIERYLLEGQKELESIALNELKQYMYKEGEGEMIERENVDESTKEQKSRKVCWKLDKRGMLGESLLHVLVLCNTDAHTQIAMFLVELYPALAHDIVEGEEYYGATAMHFAIAYENSKLVKKLVEIGADFHQRANGKFFMPIDQQWPIPRAKTNFEGLSYFGEYPLSWAACCDDEPSYNLLIKHGADPNLQDTFGNNILHVLVIRDKLKMYGYALRHPIRPASDHLCNKFGLTPLTLACKLGRNTIFREMLEFSSLEFWRYSNITCSGYPLNALDSLQPNGRANLNSALMIILKGNSTEHLDMLEGGVIQRLLEEKWKTFAQRCFYKRLLMMLVHLLNLSIAVFLRPTTREPLLGKTDATNIIRYCAEIATCLGCVGFGIIQQVQEILAQGLLGFLYCLTTSPTKSTFVLSCFLILSCIPCRVIGDRQTEDILLVMAIPGSWFYLIFFAGAVRLTGPFVTMIYSMLVGDMFRFSIIYMIFMFAFTQAFFFLFKSQPTERADSKKRFSTYPVTWMGLFHMTLGSYEYEEFRETYYQKLTQLVFALFMVLTPILLLNMLIAMMGNTYCEVITQSEKEWVKQWANIIVALERSIDSESAREFIQTYSIKMPSSTKDTEVRGVIVIKSKPKSKAKEKKQALLLWKRVGKRTVQELRRVGGSAADVRRRYNLFPSKQPTARLRNGKIILEWNPIPAPIYKPLKPATTGKSNQPNAGFDDLLSQVTSASGIDIEKPNPAQDNKAPNNEENSSGIPHVLPEYNQCAIQSAGYTNLAYEHDILTNKPDMQVKMGGQNSFKTSNEMYNGSNIPVTPREPPMPYGSTVTSGVPPPGDLIPATNLTRQLSMDHGPGEGPPVPYANISHYGMQRPSDMAPPHTNFAGQSSMDPLNEERGISVNVQTKIISTKITKVRTPRSKEMPLLLRRREYSGSSSDDAKKDASNKKKIGGGKAYNLPYRVKHKRRRKRNQISYEEKISLDNLPYNFPISMETTIHKTNVDTPKKTDQYPLFLPKSEEEPQN